MTTKTDLRFLFFTGYLQVFFVAINTYFITKGFWMGILVTSFLISFIWTYNVSRKDGKVSFTNLNTRLAYASGASAGCISGVAVAYLLIN
jgi:hypothetical protein